MSMAWQFTFVPNGKLVLDHNNLLDISIVELFMQQASPPLIWKDGDAIVFGYAGQHNAHPTRTTDSHHVWLVHDGCQLIPGSIVLGRRSVHREQSAEKIGSHLAHGSPFKLHRAALYSTVGDYVLCTAGLAFASSGQKKRPGSIGCLKE